MPYPDGNPTLGEQLDEDARRRFYIDDLIKEGREAWAEVDRLKAMLDPPICRLQFPDGHVPGNIAECAEGWKKHAEKFWTERDRLKATNAELVKALEEIAGGHVPAGAMPNLEQSPLAFRAEMWEWSERRALAALAKAREG